MSTDDMSTDDGERLRVYRARVFEVQRKLARILDTTGEAMDARAASNHWRELHALAEELSAAYTASLPPDDEEIDR